MTLKFDLLFKTLTLVITYEPWEKGLSYFTCLFLVIRPFTRYHNFWPSDLCLELRISYTKCCYSNLVASRRTLLSSDNSCYNWYYNVLSCDLDLEVWSSLKKFNLCFYLVIAATLLPSDNYDICCTWCIAVKYKSYPNNTVYDYLHGMQ